MKNFSIALTVTMEKTKFGNIPQFNSFLSFLTFFMKLIIKFSLEKLSVSDVIFVYAASFCSKNKNLHIKIQCTYSLFRWNNLKWEISLGRQLLDES